MMRTIFISSSVLFWLAVAGFWIASVTLSNPLAETSVSTQKHYTLKDVAQHNQGDECWMVIDNVVYDFTDYIPMHPAPLNMMLDWCGREASEAFHTKTKGRPHSNYAIELLEKYRIGELRQ